MAKSPIGLLQPQIFVISRPAIDAGEVERFLAAEGTSWRRTPGISEGEGLVELAGRVCYMSFADNQSSRTNLGYITNLISQGHESVLEHAAWTFILSGITRAFTHQLVRHRAGFSYSQLSQQYHEETEAHFLVSPALASRPDLMSEVERVTADARRIYSRILETLKRELPYESSPAREELRSIRSAARSVLPESTETKIVVTANARAVRHFLAVRGNVEGDIEMRLVSKLILEAVRADSPALFHDFHIENLPDDSPAVRKNI